MTATQGNIYEQMDPTGAAAKAALQGAQSQGNVYTQMDPTGSAAKAYLQAQQANQAPLNHYRWRDVPGAAVKNLAASTVNFAGNVAHAANPQNWGEDIKGIASIAGALPAKAIQYVGGPQNALALAASLPIGAMNPSAIMSAVSSNPSLMNHLVNTANAIGGDYKSHYGSIDAIKRTIAEDPIRFGTDVSTLLAPFEGPIAHGAEEAVNAIGRVSPAASRAAAAVAHAAPVVANPLRAAAPIARTAGNVTRTVVNALSPQDRMLIEASEGRGPAVLAATAGPHQIVPGSFPTGAQAAAPAGATRIAALGADAEKNLPTQAMGIQDANNAARLNAIRAVVPHADLPAAIQLRNENAARDYAAAGIPSNDAHLAAMHPAATVHIPVDADLLDLLHSPSMQEAVTRASNMAAEERRPFHIGAGATTSAQDLHNIKMALDDQIKNPEQFGIAASEVGRIRNTRNQFVDWLEYHNPEYRTARENYQAASVPIDQTRLLNYYLGKLQNPLMGEDAATLNANAFASSRDHALNEALGNTNIRKATGQQRVLHERNLLSPQQTQALDNVQADLSRAKQSEQQAKAASQYKGHLNTAVTDAIDSIPLVSAVTHIPIVNRLVNAAVNPLNNRIANTVGNALLTPGGLNQVLTNALAREAGINTLSNRIHQVGRGIQTVNRAPALYNMLQMERTADQKKK